MNTELDKAKAELEKFLQDRPHLCEYQKEIDRLLDGAGTDANRMAVLGTIMQGKLLELQKQMLALVEEVKGAVADKQ